MSSPNRLVASAPAEPTGFFNAGTGDNGWATGFSIADSAMDAYKGLFEGGWIEGGLGVVGLVADAASMAIDPFGTLLSSAASFLMEHVQPLKEALDWLAGDPPVIQSYSTTWNNVSQELGAIAGDYKAAVDGTGEWTGAAAESYRKAAGEQLDALSGAASTAGSVGTVVGVMGMVVGFVREMVRDLIADLVAKLITWVLEAVFTLGFGTPVIVAQAVTAISKWAARIGELIQKLITTIKRVSPLLGKLVEIFTKIMKVVGKLTGKVTGLDVISTKSVKPGGLFPSANAPDLSPSTRGGPPSPSTPDSSPHSSSPSSDSAPDTSTRASDGSTAHTPSRTPDSASAPRTPDSAPSPAAPSTPDAPHPTRDTGQTVQSSAAAPEAPSRRETPQTPTRTSDGSPSSARPQVGPPGARNAGGNAPSSPTASRPTAPNQGWTGTPGSRGEVGSSATTPRPFDTSTSAARADAPAHPTSMPAAPSTPSSGMPSGAIPSGGIPSGGMPSGSGTPPANAPHTSSTGAPSATAPSAGAPHAPSSHAPSAPRSDAPMHPQSSAPPSPTASSTPSARTDAAQAPSRPDTPRGVPSAPSRPSAPNAPHGGPSHPEAPSRPGAPHRPDNRPDGARSRGTDTDSPHRDPAGTTRSEAATPRSPNTRSPHSLDAGTPHRPGADAPHHPDADRPHDSSPDKHHDGDPDTPNSHDPDAPPADRPSVEAAHARHAETTPAGVSHHGGDKDMGDLPHRVPHDPRYFTADVHITPDGKARIGGHDYTPAEYADMLKRSGYDSSKPVRLIGCDASRNDFARQLSKNLDAPVLAPNKPAWTDSRGRVFTSDPEIRPDGTRRPKIPPNGEWETHHPDGTRTNASEDGFAPGTPDKDKELDPSDARDRMARRNIRDEPVHIETLEPRALMEEKLKDRDYRDKYYDGPDKNGEYSRKNANQVDANGDDVPKLVENPKGSGNFDASSDAYTPAKFREDMPEVRHNATADQKSAAQEIIDRREASLARTKSADDAYRKEIAGDRDASQQTIEERRAAHAERTDVGEELGEHAAADAVRDSFPPEKFDVTPLHDPALKGSGRFDQVYEVHNKETGETRLVIVEAKGPNGELGTRRHKQENFQQGHPRYVDSVIENMRQKGTAGEQALSKRLKAARTGYVLDYQVVKAKVTGSGTSAEYGGYSQKHFDLSR
ncbi:hypothetical protein [Actinosynnema sp. NPDC020468]|uniref:hypothetical protein n=1 Tax=Actinosynnema sp. NPDC020468 TaxID=3154488 RepID=UPI0033CFDB07